jgi:hypothetical protein
LRLQRAQFSQAFDCVSSLDQPCQAPPEPLCLFGKIRKQFAKKRDINRTIPSPKQLLVPQGIRLEYGLHAFEELPDTPHTQPIVHGRTAFFAFHNPSVPKNRKVPGYGRQIGPDQVGQFTDATLAVLGQLIHNHQPGRMCQRFDNRGPRFVDCPILITHNSPSIAVKRDPALSHDKRRKSNGQTNTGTNQAQVGLKT